MGLDMSRLTHQGVRKSPAKSIMSKARPNSQKRRYKIWIEPSGKPVDPVVASVGKLLPNLIIEFAILDDVTGPLCASIVGAQYQSELTGRLREPITKAIKTAALEVTEEQMNQICRGAATEIFVVRSLNEGRLIGEISLHDIKHLELYQTYRAYFEQSPEIVIKAFEVAINAAMTPRRDEANN